MDQSQELELKKEDSKASIFGAPLAHSHSITSILDEEHFAVLPHGVVLEGWSDEDKEELNDHVRHLLHSRKAGFRRSMRAFGKYVRTRMFIIPTPVEHVLMRSSTWGWRHDLYLFNYILGSCLGFVHNW